MADDSFIVEAPSFVVPYLIEKTAAENLKKTVDALILPPPPPAAASVTSGDNKEDVVVLSEDESDDPKTTTAATADKSSMKSEMEKSIGLKPDADKEEDNYFTGPIGRFFLDIGLSLVQEYVQGDLLRVQKRKVHKGTKITDPSLSISALTKGYYFPPFLFIFYLI